MEAPPAVDRLTLHTRLSAPSGTNILNGVRGRGLASTAPFFIFTFFILLFFQFHGNAAAVEPDSRPWLGVAVTSPEGGAPGALVTDVAPDGPGAASGIEKGTVITSIDDVPVEGPEGFLSLMRRYSPGDTIIVGLGSGAGARTVSVVLGSAPGYIYSVDGDGGPGGAGYPRGMGGMGVVPGIGPDSSKGR